MSWIKIIKNLVENKKLSVIWHSCLTNKEQPCRLHCSLGESLRRLQTNLFIYYCSSKPTRQSGRPNVTGHFSMLHYTKLGALLPGSPHRCSNGLTFKDIKTSTSLCRSICINWLWKGAYPTLLTTAKPGSRLAISSWIAVWISKIFTHKSSKSLDKGLRDSSNLRAARCSRIVDLFSLPPWMSEVL